MKNAWQLYFSRPNKRTIFLFTLVLLAITLISFVYFLTFNENRTGYIFNDPILNLFEPVAISEITFFRASRKHIINLKWVEGIESWFNGGLMVKLRGGEQVEISRRQAAKLKDMMSL